MFFRCDIIDKAREILKAFQLNENDIILEHKNLMSLDDPKLEKYDLIYTSAACGGLFDCKLYYLSLKYNLGLLCNKATTQNVKNYCNIKATRIAQAEVYKTGAKTEADLSTNENLQRRDIFFIDVQKLFDDANKSDLLEAWVKFREWIKEDDKSNRSTEKNINQAWYNKIFESVKTRVTQSDANMTMLVDINLTYWGNFIRNANTLYNIAEPLQHVKELVNDQRMTDKKWLAAKWTLCKEIIEIFQQNTQSIEDLFPDIDTIISNLEQSIHPDGKAQTEAQPLLTQPSQTSQTKTSDNSEEIKQILIIYTSGTWRDLNSMECHINKTFGKWLEMVEFCGEEMRIHKMRDITILVKGEEVKENCDLWTSILQERTEARFVEIVFDVLKNNDEKFNIIIDSIDPATIYENCETYFYKLVVKQGFIFLFKMSFNRLASRMMTVVQYENATYELMTTKYLDPHVNGFSVEVSRVENADDSTHEINDASFSGFNE